MVRRVYIHLKKSHDRRCSLPTVLPERFGDGAPGLDVLDDLLVGRDQSRDHLEHTIQEARGDAHGAALAGVEHHDVALALSIGGGWTQTGRLTGATTASPMETGTSVAQALVSAPA